MRIVDAHHHLWDLTKHPLPWLEGEEENPLRRDFVLRDLLVEIEQTDITQTVCVQAGLSVAEARWLLDLGGAASPLAGVVAQADLSDPHFASTLDGLRDHRGAVPLVGIRDPMLVRRGLLEPLAPWQAGLSLLTAAGLPLDLLAPDGSLGVVARLALAHPELTFIVDHLGQPPVGGGRAGLRRWAHGLAMLARNVNVICKLSGLRSEWRQSHCNDLRFVVDTASQAFGAPRLMFGSDWPVTSRVGGYHGVIEMWADLLPVTDSGDSDLVWGGTARRVYRLA